MVSFRHHLISIIAIFLALAVGIALGAGPLRSGASSLLSGQNETLTAERDQARADLDVATSEIVDRDAVIDAMAGYASEGVLEGVTVGLIALPGTEGTDLDAARTALVTAGAQITVETAVTSAWADSDLAFRQSYSGQIAGYLANSASSDATPEYVLAAALAQSLSGGAEADLIGELLVAGDTPFVTEVPESGAAVFVVVGPREVPEGIDWYPLLSAFADAAPTVGIGDGVVLPARAAGTAASTIDSLPASFATAVLPLAVAATIAGNGGHFGVMDGADAVVPPLGLAALPVERVEEPSQEPAEEPVVESTDDPTDESTDEPTDEPTETDDEPDE